MPAENNFARPSPRNFISSMITIFIALCKAFFSYADHILSGQDIKYNLAVSVSQVDWHRARYWGLCIQIYDLLRHWGLHQATHFNSVIQLQYSAAPYKMRYALSWIDSTHCFFYTSTAYHSHCPYFRPSYPQSVLTLATRSHMTTLPSSAPVRAYIVGNATSIVAFLTNANPWEGSGIVHQVTFSCLFAACHNATHYHCAEISALQHQLICGPILILLSASPQQPCISKDTI